MTDHAFAPLVRDPLPAPVTPTTASSHDSCVDFFAANPVARRLRRLPPRRRSVAGPVRGGRRARGWRCSTGTRRALAALDEAALSPDERIDRAHPRWRRSSRRDSADDVLRDEAWDPLTVVYLLGQRLVRAARPRVRAVVPSWRARSCRASRRMPGDARGRARGAHGPARPAGVAAPPGHGARRSCRASRELIDDGLAEARTRAAAGEAPELVTRTGGGCGDRARAALDGFRADLDTEVRPRAAGEGRLGAELFAQKLRYTLSSDMTPDAAAGARLARTTAPCAPRCSASRAQIWPQWVPRRAAPRRRAG